MQCRARTRTDSESHTNGKQVKFPQISSSDRAKSQEGFTSKSQPRGGGGTGTGPRRYGGGKPGGGERDTGRSRGDQQQSGTESGGWGLNGGWKSGGGNTQQDSWKETGTWGDNTAAGGTTDPFPTIGTYTAESTAKGVAEKDDEWVRRKFRFFCKFFKICRKTGLACSCPQKQTNRLLLLRQMSPPRRRLP